MENFIGLTKILDRQVGLESYAGPGHWNDPNMLEVGNGDLILRIIPPRYAISGCARTWANSWVCLRRWCCPTVLSWLKFINLQPAPEIRSTHSGNKCFTQRRNAALIPAVSCSGGIVHQYRCRPESDPRGFNRLGGHHLQCEIEEIEIGCGRQQFLNDAISAEVRVNLDYDGFSLIQMRAAETDQEWRRALRKIQDFHHSL